MHQQWLKDFLSQEPIKYISTGFPSLDKALGGGINAGLYFIGSESSLGKTTFILQIADQIAATGQEVLFFSLEMSTHELITKTISRLSYTLATNKQDALSSIQVMINKGEGATDCPAAKQLIARTIDYYNNTGAPYFSVIEGTVDTGTSHIREEVENFIKITGKRPVVFIDHLQILAIEDLRATDKQNTEKAVVNLRRICRDFNIPIICISNFNRGSYTAPVSITDFKESVVLEHFGDCLIGLQYFGMDYRDNETPKDREKRIRTLLKEANNKAKDGLAQQIQVKILKNRQYTIDEVCLNFIPKYNCFEERTDDEALTFSKNMP